MTSRIATATLTVLLLAVLVGLMARPEPSASTSAAYTETVAVLRDEPAPPGSELTFAAIVFGFMVAGSAAIGALFFAPVPAHPARHRAPVLLKGGRGLRRDGTPAISLVQRTRCGLADLHQELQIVLRLLQAVDQQVDRLMRIQARQHATQLVQHRRLVRAEQ